MDKSRDVRRGGATRFSPAKRQIKQSLHTKLLSGLDGVGGDVDFSEKSKKERLRRLSVVGMASSSNEGSEMGCCSGSDGEDELPPQAPSPTTGSGRRLKLPKRLFDDCNTVDHASVPRKLRSAMKKRNRESISPPLPDSKKMNHAINGVESSRKDGVKKSKLKMPQGDSDWSPRRPMSGPITKEEEEVVATLYALAGMFPNDNTTDQTKLEAESSEIKSLALREGESSTPAFEDSTVPKYEEDLKSICPPTTADTVNPSSNVEGSCGETVQANSLNEPSGLGQPGLPSGKQVHMESDSPVPQVNLQTMSLLSKSEPNSEKPSCNAVSFGIPSELSLESGLKEPKQQEGPVCERNPGISLWLATAVGLRQEQQHTIKESKGNGSVLWPGFSSTASHGSEIHGPSLQSSAAKIPAWLSTATCAAGPDSSENGVSTEKDSRVVVDRKSWKRCAAHVYISRLIQVLQFSKSKERLPIQPNQLRPNEGSKQGVLMATNNLNGVRNGLNGVLPASSVVGSVADKNQNEARNGILLHKRLHQDQQQAAVASGVYTSQNQSFDFLTLSARGGGPEANNSTNRAGNGLEPLTQLHVPYLHSLAQHQTLMAFSQPPTRYSSSPYPDQLSTAAAVQQVQLQLPPYLGSPFCGPPHMGPPASTKQQQQQQQQRIWAAQLAAQCRPGGISVPYMANWQNGRQDSLQSAQTILPPPPSSLEVLGPKYPSISQQHQQLIAMTSSLPPTGVKWQHHYRPSGSEDNGGGFRSDGAPQLQLLCNEHL